MCPLVEDAVGDFPPVTAAHTVTFLLRTGAIVTGVMIVVFGGHDHDGPPARWRSLARGAEGSPRP